MLATSLSLLAVLGLSGLAIDLGRMYIAKHEAQNYVDAASLRAALELNGTQTGLQNARDTVAASVNRWNFGFNPFSGALVEFAPSAAGPWESNPPTAANHLSVRVTGQANVPMTLMQTIIQQATRPVRAMAISSQVSKTKFREGLFPFSPFAHPPSAQLPGADPITGLTPGQIYTLRWAASPKLNNQNTTCSGDRYQDVLDIAQAGGGEERGFIENTSASIIRQSIVYDYQSVFRQVGDSVTMTGGAKQTMQDAIVERIRQDTDTTSNTFAEYFNGGRTRGNGRRLVAAPINLGAPGGYQIVQIGAFYLLDESTYLSAQGGNKPFCAEYVGAYVQGSTGPGAGGPGYYVVRLQE
ncbi:MAG: hypothetical protein KIT09_07405 [Bryobacteraceae bacterium]|nr:hypothetical protein [Bryobacteraceae bacterium]